MTINVSQDVENSINAAVRSGQFASADEMIARLVREYAQRFRLPTVAPSSPERNALQIPKAEQADEVTSAPSILDMVDELRKRVPPEEFAKLPTDGARQLDHYIYGLPKRADA